MDIDIHTDRDIDIDADMDTDIDDTCKDVSICIHDIDVDVGIDMNRGKEIQHYISSYALTVLVNLFFLFVCFPHTPSILCISPREEIYLLLFALSTHYPSITWFMHFNLV